MIVLNLLMFSTIMILMMAVGPYGNHLAAALATTALVLVLLVSWLAYKKESGATIKRRRGFFFSLSSSEERKKEERINGRQHTNHGDHEMKNMGDGKVALLAERAQKAAAEIMQTTALTANAISGDKDISSTAYIGTMTALGAMIPTAMCFGKKAKLTPKEIEERGQEEAFKLVNPETMLFTALLASHTLVSVTADGGTSFEFGPHVLYEALSDWEKLTGKSPDGIFDPKMLEAARAAGSGSALPLEELRAKRAQIHGNRSGSIN